MVIGLMGLVLNNGNMGCVALTYSMINILQQISIDIGTDFSYLIFERNIINEEEYIYSISELFKIDRKNIDYCMSGIIVSKKAIKYKNSFVKNVRKCDLIIDLTQGDSFSDIYGLRRFYSWTLEKYLVEKCKKPLILGPQTYGPYDNYFTKLFAKKVLKNSYSIYSRDDISKDYLEHIGVNHIKVYTDIAMCLPYKDTKKVDKVNKFKIGINISGLLWNEEFEKTNRSFELVLDYQEYSMKLIEHLISVGYEVLLIPHVTEDISAILDIAETFWQVNVINELKNPIEIKSIIAKVDYFIGARMHATIAAFSSGVPTIPIAYSRKFRGVFDSYSYPYVIDATELNTSEALNKTLSYLDQKEEMKRRVELSQKVIKKNMNQFIDSLKNDILMLIGIGK